MTRRLVLKGLVLAAMLLVSAMLAGCHDIGGTTGEYPGEDPGEEPTSRDPVGEKSDPGEEGDGGEAEPTTENESRKPSRLGLELHLASVDEPVFTNDEVVLQVELRTDNESYQELEWAGVRWSLESQNGDTQTGPDGHQHGLTTEDDPGTGGYNVSWRPASATTYHLRAHLQADGHHYWSDETAIDVIDPVEEVDAEADETVRLRTNLTDPCEGDTYSQDPLEIGPGTVVKWENAANCDHTATHDAEDPLWDTGVVEPNNVSEQNYRFNKPGTYEVRCDIHPGMQAQIIVG